MIKKDYSFKYEKFGNKEDIQPLGNILVISYKKILIKDNSRL